MNRNKIGQKTSGFFRFKLSSAPNRWIIRFLLLLKINKKSFNFSRTSFCENLQEKIFNSCNWKLKRRLVSFDGMAWYGYKNDCTVFLSTKSLRDENASNIRTWNNLNTKRKERKKEKRKKERKKERKLKKSAKQKDK